MLQVFQTLTFAWNNSTKAFATGSSANQHSDVTVRFFESDTPVIERAGNSPQLDADFRTVVTLYVTVDLDVSLQVSREVRIQK